eukprot:g6303.t1
MPMLLRQLAGSIYIENDRLKMLGSLGEGGFAVVHKMELISKDKNSREVVAVKKLKPGVIEDDKDLKELIEESNVLRKLQHRGIVQFKGIGCFDDSSIESMQESIFLAEEFMSGSTLKNVILNQMRFSPQREYWMISAWKWLIQIAEALSYLHMCTPSVIHRDVKPENVLMSSKNLKIANAKIADFGLHKRMNKISQRQREASTGLLDSSTMDSKHDTEFEPHEDQKQVHFSYSVSQGSSPNRDLSSYSLDIPSHFRILKKSSSLNFCSFRREESSLDVVPEDSPIKEHALGYPTLSSAYSVPQIVIREEPSPVRLVFPPDKETPENNKEQFEANETRDEANGSTAVSLQTIVSESLQQDRKVRGGQLTEIINSHSFEEHSSHMESWRHQKTHHEEVETGHRPTMSISPSSSAAYHFLFVPDRSKECSLKQTRSPFENKRQSSVLETKQHGSSQALDQLMETKVTQYTQEVAPKHHRKSVNWISSLSASKLALGLSGTNVVSGIVGSLMYMAPEVYKGKHYDEKVDVFGFGVVMYELLSSELILIRVLARARRPSEMKKLLKRHAKSVAKGYREEIPSDWPVSIRKLIEECWHQDPQQRPSFTEINDRLVKIREEGCINQMDKKIANELNPKNPERCSCCILS